MTSLMNRLFLIWLLSSFVAIVHPSLAQKRNVLFVVVDDLPVHIEPYLSPSHPLKNSSASFTPNLQALSQNAIVFHRAYAQNAACNPSRASMLTSRTPIEIQLFTKFSFKNLKSKPLTMPKFFQRTHYVVGIGKIFHAPWANQFNKYIHVSTGDTVCGKGKSQCTLAKKNLIDDEVAARALWLIDKAPSNRPWMAFVGFHRPHWMYSTTPELYNEVATVEGPLFEQVNQSSRVGALDFPNPLTNGSPLWSGASSSNARTTQSASATKATETRKWVYASTQWMDSCLGRLLDGIKERNQWNNTIVVLAADNGVMMFDRGQSGKSVLFNSAKRVPLMIRHPDYPATFGKRTSGMVELMDIFPTVADLLSLKPPASANSGISLKPIMQLLNSDRVSPGEAYKTSIKLGSITIETRCATAPGVLKKLKASQNYTRDWIACHQLNNVAGNRVDMFGISLQTADWNYVEWRVAQFTGNSFKNARWDTAGLWGRELYSFKNDDGLVNVSSVEFEAANLAPCLRSCYPRSLSYPWLPETGDGFYKLPSDDPAMEFDPPDLELISEEYRDVVRRLSLALRAIIRDKQPVCSGHGTANPVTGECDQCIFGWTGSMCEVPVYAEIGTEAFPAPPSPAPSTSPSRTPTRSPTFIPTKSPVTNSPTKQPVVRPPTTRRPKPTRFPTRRRRRGLSVVPE